MSVPIEKTLNDVRQDLFARIESVQEAGYLPESLNLNRGILRGIIELWAWGLYQLYLFLVVVLTQAYPSTATGAWLDLHCTQVSKTRERATQARGRVVFFRSGTDGNVVIPEGRIVKTKVDGLGQVYRFVTTEEEILPDGEAEVTVPVMAESYGSDSNVTTGMICELATTVPGIDGVRNDADWLTTEGSDREDDDRLRLRYELAWAEINGCTADAYRSWAFSIAETAGVEILDQHPRGQGTVDVIIRGAAGIPTAELISQVGSVVMEKKPINDDVDVYGPIAVNVAVDIELELTGGDPVQIVNDAENRIRALFFGAAVEGVDPLEIGMDVTQDMLSYQAQAAGGSNVKNVNFTSPDDDVTIPETGLAVLASINITYVEVAE